MFFQLFSVINLLFKLSYEGFIFTSDEQLCKKHIISQWPRAVNINKVQENMHKTNNAALMLLGIVFFMF